MNAFYAYTWVLFIQIQTVFGPPVRQCLLQTEESRAPRTPCGEGNLQPMTELVQIISPENERFGTMNLVDLILTRAGIFDVTLEKLAMLHICPKHHNELGLGWTKDKKNRPTIKLRQVNKLKCSMPKGLAGFTDHQVVLATSSLYILKEEARALLMQKNTLVPAGTGNFYLSLVYIFKFPNWL